MATQFGQATFSGSGGLSFPDYLRPDADDLDGNWTQETGATNLFQSIDESVANDADYIKSGINPVADVCRVRLSDPGENVRSPARVRVRYKHFGDLGNLIVRLKQGTTEIASWTYANIPSTFTTSTEVLTDAQFAAITDFTNLFLEFQADAEDTTYFVVDYLNTKVVSYPYDSDVIGGLSDADVLVWYRAASQLGARISDARLALVNTLITGLKADGVWSKLDRLWLFAMESQGAALVDLVRGAAATAKNSPTFTTDRGFNGNGSTSWVDSNFTWSTAGGNYTRNAAHISIWDVTTGSGQNTRLFGEGSGPTTFSGGTHLYSSLFGSAFFRLNTNAGGGFSVPDSRGFFVGSRTSSTNIDAYRNGSSLGSNTATADSNDDTPTFAFGFDVGVSTYNSDQIAAASCGGALTSTDVSNFYNRLRTYMTAVGVP